MTFFELASLFDEVLKNRDIYGTTDADGPCLQAVGPTIAQFGIPDKFLFWHDVYPTRKVH